MAEAETAEKGPQAPDRIVGVVLAGGKGVRMGHADKPLLLLDGITLIQRVLAIARPQVEQLVISLNRNPDRFRNLGLPLLADTVHPCSGPLAGICTAMSWYKDQGQAFDYLACFPADVPSFPADLVQQLLRLAAPAQRLPEPPVLWVKTGTQPQPLFSLWPADIASALAAAVSSGCRGPLQYFENHPNLVLELPATTQLSFLNINTPAELDQAERVIRQSRNARN